MNDHWVCGAPSTPLISTVAGKLGARALRVDHDGSLPVVDERAERADRFAELEAASLARQDPEHAGHGGGHRRDPAVHHGVAESDELVALHARHRAEPHRGDVAGHELDADGASVDVVLGCVGVHGGAGARPLHGVEPERLEEVTRHLGRAFAEPAEQNGSRDGHEVRPLRPRGRPAGARRELARVFAQIVATRIAHVRRALRGPGHLADRGVARVVSTGGDGASRQRSEDGQRARQLVQHRLNGGDAGDGFGAELPAVGVSAHHAPVDEDGASAHSRDDLGDLEPRVRRLDEDEILMRAKTADGAENFDVETLGLGAAKDGQAVAFHADFDFGDRHDPVGRPRNRLRELERQGQGHQKAQ